MSKQVTIKLSDGTPHTGTLDQDGFLLLPRGKKPAEPWWSRCEADPQGQSDKPHGLSPIAVPVPCGGWEWHDDEWFRIRPLPGESWESIAPQQRDYTNWQEGLGDSAKPEDYDQQPGKYEVESRFPCATEAYEKCLVPIWAAHAEYRVRLRQSEPQVESESDFMRRMLGLCVFAVTMKASNSIIVLKTAPLLPPADALRLARLIAEAKA